MKIYKIYCPVYARIILVIFNAKKDYLLKISSNVEEFFHSDATAQTFFLEDGRCILAFYDQDEKVSKYHNDTIYSISCHESFHIAFNILIASGIVICKESEESFAYYQTWIFKQIIKKYEEFTNFNLLRVNK